MKLGKTVALTMLAVLAAGCADSKFNEQPPGRDGDESDDNPSTEITAAARDELYRPQVHFTPARNWINDPNGMVYLNGTYHLYYQYNPQGNVWGNMSWGHATSTDLIHWEEQPVAMLRNEWGDIFSGSAIVDKDNVAGFGKDAILAFYTASGQRQQQCLAYSTDGGITYTQYAGNPIIPNTSLDDFRDPKVIYHAESGQWIMCLALGWSHQIEFWGSKDLKNWNKLSTFTSTSERCNIGQWECPDLIRLPYNGEDKWVLIVSNNPGGPAGGSGTEYFVGDFDGTRFTAMSLDYPLWLDYGADNYAGVTWSNTPGGRAVMIGWMNNWNYAGDVPCDPWRSAMTLPRELVLREVSGSPLLATTVVKELDGIASQWNKAENGRINTDSAYEARLTVSTKTNNSFRLENDNGEYLEVEVNAAAECVIVKRTKASGNVTFNGTFALPGIRAPFNTAADSLTLHIFVDQSSVEIISEDGTLALTNLVFPTAIYNRISGADSVDYRTLQSIWK